MKRFVYLSLLILLLPSCQEITEWYLGIPMQPKFEQNSYQCGLNIFGILRPDSTGSLNNSFIEIQKVMPAVGVNDSILVGLVQVEVSNITPGTENAFCEFYPDTVNSIVSKTNYKPGNRLSPKPGEIYSLSCIYSDFPVLRAYTIIPNKPDMAMHYDITEGNTFVFEIMHDTTIFMFDILFYSGGQMVNALRLPADTEINTQVSVENTSEPLDSARIFAYDYNIAEYYLTSNTSLNFNKYRNSFSTVENGYGVFGSVNFSTFIFK